MSSRIRTGLLRAAAVTFALFVAGASCRAPTETVPSGAVLWRLPGRGWAVTPAYDRTAVFFASFAHEVLAVDKASGRVRWRRATGMPGRYTAGRNILLAGGVVVVPDMDLHAFDRVDGTRRWTFAPANGDQTGHGVVATDGHLVFAATPEGRVYALDAAAGSQRWVTDLTGGRDMVSTFHPVVVDGVVFVGLKRFGPGATGALVALDAGTGVERWRHEFAPEIAGRFSGCFGGATAVGARILVTAEDGRVYALDRKSGAVAWIAPRVHDTTTTSGDLRAVAVAGSIAVVGSVTGIIVGLDVATGREVWRSSRDLPSAYAPIVTASGSAYVGHTSSLVVYDAATGRIRWMARPDGDRGGLWGPPAIDDDRIFASGLDGFYAVAR